MVQDLGHQVLIARTGAEALALLEAGNPIDILLTELAQAAMAAAPSIKVVITTGYPGHSDLLRNHLPVLPKPFTRIDLDLMIQSLIEPPPLAPVGVA